MSKVERGVVKSPNEEHRGDRRANGFLPLIGVPGVMPTVVADQDGKFPNGPSPLIAGPSVVHPPDHRFHIDAIDLPEAPCAMAPGGAAIPVEPVEPTSRVVADSGFFGSSRV